ncbi:hypothetical protein SPRG_06069 [Saprolegnia parasitica CBS 223.65]|uniref:Vacuolar protein 8 n=1 Tax=Saprolegnia parasitica (strain CBS 223.65) TaxID=695850 RepID=A0A067CE22_SAPPC|nr:hypothetical protein SPRG_06069 [Saprolegnia parasitica CBS 223.65]KDO29014.1 hypothetical protein SPRG_06069 [Saprolegnia parasitica CBS 223.65]|eukprot:XP_012200184.1 hypothetical protein SPRG_06069 [Saprolegnia parasitica CBS 223.65]
MGASGSKGSKEEFTYEDSDEGFTEALKVNLQRLIAYAKSADASLQREVAEKLANEAVKPDRQVQIVELDGLQLLLPLTQSKDTEVQRLAAHALANLSVNSDNQTKMANEGGIDMLIDLLASDNEHVQRQAAKALANLGVNVDNKEKIAKAAGSSHSSSWRARSKSVSPSRPLPRSPTWLSTTRTRWRLHATVAWNQLFAEPSRIRWSCSRKSRVHCATFPSMPRTRSSLCALVASTRCSFWCVRPTTVFANKPRARS